MTHAISSHPLLSIEGAAEAADQSGSARKATDSAANRPVYIETYGCQMNVADTELVASILRDAGYRIVDKVESADIILVNTCAVRENAEERVFGRVSQLHGLRARNPGLTIGVLGCMAQHLTAELPQRAPFVDLVMGPDSYRRLPAILAQTSEETLLDVRLSRSENYVGVRPERKTGTNAWVTIIRGCDKFCTFCIVPFVRGRERSLPAEEILQQVRNIAAEGFREVTLLGQTVNSYDDGHTDFADLLRAVAAIDSIERVRFTSPYPKDFNERTIEAMARTAAVCPSLHLPVQSGSDHQLHIMERGYSIGEYVDLVSRLRAAIPDLALTTDIMVGFCGETETDFRETCELMETLRFDSAFMFKYSERSGTRAHRAIADDVPESVKGQRLAHIIDLQESISADMNRKWVGETVEVLVEGASKRPAADGRATTFGRSPQAKTVIFPGAATPNSMARIEILSTTSHTLLGTRVV